MVDAPRQGGHRRPGRRGAGAAPPAPGHRRPAPPRAAGGRRPHTAARGVDHTGARGGHHSLKVTMHRYERVALGDQDTLERSAVEHERIAECLLRGDPDAAVVALKENWNSGTRTVEHTGSWSTWRTGGEHVTRLPGEGLTTSARRGREPGAAGPAF
ncbi:FCD domain-containing protein [Streptomyces sp. NPDC014734]|uniref:FCD domain-containing protein n=1 Tax=Streptomyces sp. NPDC014734 TaxID=3364886 RepID=UPI003702676B